MNDRLNRLRRQQELIREHLVWLETEIARESGATADPLSPAPASVIPESIRPSTEDADVLFARFAAEERLNPQGARRGCLLAFGVVMLLVVGGMAAIWFWY